MWWSVFVWPRRPSAASVAGAARVGESKCKGALRVRKDLEKLAHLTAGAGVSPVLRWSSPERRQHRRERRRRNWRAGPARQWPCGEGRRGRERAQRGCGPSAWWAGLRPSFPAARCSVAFLFPFWLKLLDVWIYVINCVVIQKWWKFLYKFPEIGRTQEKY